MIEKNSKSKIKMICFPFAGGHGNEFLRWQDYFEEEIEIVPLQLSGRGNRINEEFNENFVEVIKEISNKIYLSYRDSKFIFWGHSMGGLLAFCSGVYLYEKYSISPILCFFSGCFPKLHSSNNNYLLGKSDSEIVERLIKVGGVPEELLPYPEIIKFFLPIIKSDYKLMSNSYFPSQKISCPIRTYSDEQDFVSPTTYMKDWRRYTNDYLGNMEFQGNHFFIFANEKKICFDIITILSNYMK